MWLVFVASVLLILLVFGVVFFLFLTLSYTHNLLCLWIVPS